jgi:AP-3 complex subunit beta
MQYANPPQPTLTFFPAVLKTLSHPYPSTRPLVYNYLLHHAEADPDTTLLSINTIQKSLSDSNPRVRAMALKTMAGIRVPMISQLVSLAIKKGASDLSPIVRKAAALACVKCVTLDPNTRPQVEEYLAKLLADQQYYVAGAAVQAFMEICPEKLDMIHPVYRKLCKMVVDMDEWGQLAILRLMATYARKSFPRRTKRAKRAATREQKTQDFYEDLEPKEEQEHDFEDVEVLDPDLELLLKSVQPLLQSRNSAVIVSVARLYLYLSPTEHLPNAIGPLIALLRSPKDVQQVALYNIVQVCLVVPMHFLPYVRHFLIRTSEAPQSWRLKLEVLTLLFPYCEKSMQDLILAELEHFSKGHNADLVRESVRAIGRCSQASDAKTSRRCLSLLLKQIHSADSVLVGEAMEVVRHMIQRSPDEHHKTVVRLARNLDSLTSPAARASIIWLVGEFAGTDPEKNIAADVLRILVRNYADETDEVRAQIVLLAAKVYLHDLNAKNAKTKALDALKSPTEEQPENQVLSPPLDEGGFAEHQTEEEEEEDPSAHTQPQEDTITLLYQHTMLLARYTPSYDLRDRARVYRALLALPTSTELASLLLLAPKPVPQAPSPSESHKGYTLGSASLVVGNAAGVNGLRGYEAIPDWVAEGDEPNAKLRDAGGVEKDVYQPQKTVSAGQMLDDALEADPGFKSNGRKAKTLDDWLDDEEDDEESESESGSGSEESEEESEYETDEDEDAESGEEESDSEDDEKAGLVR